MGPRKVIGIYCEAKLHFVGWSSGRSSLKYITIFWVA